MTKSTGSYRRGDENKPSRPAYSSFLWVPSMENGPLTLRSLLVRPYGFGYYALSSSPGCCLSPVYAHYNTVPPISKECRVAMLIAHYRRPGEASQVKIVRAPIAICHEAFHRSLLTFIFSPPSTDVSQPCPFLSLLVMNLLKFDFLKNVCRFLNFTIQIYINNGFVLVNAPDSDIMYQSSDNVRFLVHKNNLRITAPGFPLKSEHQTDPIIHLPETETVLDSLFRFCYPERHPDLTTLDFERLISIAEAAEEYRVFAAINICSLRMRYVYSSFTS